jgi:hypothetical protein
MHAFIDNQGRRWTLEITVGSIKRVKALTGVDLYALIDDGAKKLGELLTDVVGLVDVLYALCEEQCKAESISDEDFGRSFSGDALESAGEAFVEEVIFFTPNRRARQALQSLTAKGKVLRDRLLTKAEKELEAFDPETMDIELLLRKSSGSLPGNSGSTPAPSPSASSA